MIKKLFTLTALLLVFASLFSGISYGASGSFSGFDISIDRVTANGNVVTESRSNLMDDANAFSVIVEFTAVRALDDGHVEAILRGRQSGDVVSDATGTFDMFEGQNSIVLLSLVLTDGLKREDEFDLTVKIVDIRGNSEQKTYGIKTRDTRTRGRLDVSIDRVFVNNKVVAESKTNFIDESNDFDVLVEFTALEDLEDARVEAVLKDLRSGNVVADASSNFDLSQDSSSSVLLSLELLDKLKDSSSFELAVRIADAEGDSVQKVYGLRMKDGNGNGVSGGSSSRNLDISVDSVEVESRVVAENENNFVVIGESKKELDLRVRLTSLEDIQDAHIDAILTFENGDVVADATAAFDISEDENAAKKLELPLIGSFGQNSFKLKVRVIDAEGDSEEKVYGLKISKKRFPFVISSISLSPESNAEAGKNLIAKVRFRNSGVVPLDGVNVKVSIPELGVSASKFADSIDGFDTEASEEFVLKILDNTPTGTYTLRSEVTSQFGSESEVKEIPVFILGKGDQEKQIVNDKLLINVPVLKQSMKNDGTEAIYPIMLTNNGPDANSYTLLLDSGDWAGFRLSDSNTFVLEPKESKTINVYASATAASKGEHIFVATIKSNDKVLKQIPLKANVVAGKGLLAANLKNILGMLLISFVVLLAAVGLFFGVKRLAQGSNEEEMQEEMQDYY